MSNQVVIELSDENKQKMMDITYKRIVNATKICELSDSITNGFLEKGEEACIVNTEDGKTEVSSEGEYLSFCNLCKYVFKISKLKKEELKNNTINYINFKYKNTATTDNVNKLLKRIDEEVDSWKSSVNFVSGVHISTKIIKKIFVEILEQEQVLRKEFDDMIKENSF